MYKCYIRSKRTSKCYKEIYFIDRAAVQVYVRNFIESVLELFPYNEDYLLDWNNLLVKFNVNSKSIIFEGDDFYLIIDKL